MNVGKHGVSTSVGTTGAKVTVGRTGVRRTIGLPGTGLFHTEKVTSPTQEAQRQAPSEQEHLSAGKVFLIVAIALGFLLLRYVVFAR